MSKQLLSQRCNTLAERIMFIGVKNVAELLNVLGLEYRKDKTIQDIRDAVRRGLKDGMYKTEFELGMIEVHLTKVLKLKKVQNEIN